MPTELKSREEIDARFKWNLANLYADDAAWEAEIARVQGMLPETRSFQGHLAEGPEMVARWLEHMQELILLMGKIHVYASCAHAVDTTDQHAAGLNARAMGLYAQVMGAAAFSEPELLEIGPDKLKGWANEHEALGMGGGCFDQLARKAEHLRSAEVALDRYESLLQELAV